jgi:hypothetical protein
MSFTAQTRTIWYARTRRKRDSDAGLNYQVSLSKSHGRGAMTPIGSCESMRSDYLHRTCWQIKGEEIEV